MLHLWYNSPVICMLKLCRGILMERHARVRWHYDCADILDINVVHAVLHHNITCANVAFWSGMPRKRLWSGAEEGSRAASNNTLAFYVVRLRVVFAESRCGIWTPIRLHLEESHQPEKEGVCIVTWYIDLLKKKKCKYEHTAPSSIGSKNPKECVFIFSPPMASENQLQ